MSYSTIPCCIADCDKFATEEEKELRILKIPAVSHPAPPWSSVAVIGSSIRDLSSSEFKDNYLVLVFYPYDFSFSCPVDLTQFDDTSCEFEVLGAKIVAISTDSEFAHFTWTAAPPREGGIGKMKIPVLSDRNHQISKAYGVLDIDHGICMKALFVIDKEQIIRHVSISEPGLSRSVQEVLRLIHQCQFVDEHGEAYAENSEELLEDCGDHSIAPLGSVNNCRK